MSGRLAAAVIAAVLVVLAAGSIEDSEAAPIADRSGATGAARKSSMSAGAQLSALTKTRAARVLTSGLGTAEEIGAEKELANSILGSADSSITSSDKGWARLTLHLLSPDARRALAALGNPQAMTSAQVETLRRTIQMIVQNPAIRQLQREGWELRRHPARLRHRIATFLHGTRGLVDAAPTPVPDGNPFERFDAAIGDPVAGAGGRSLPAATRRIFASPGIVRYLLSLPPFALASLMPAPARDGARTATASSVSLIDSADNPSCADAQGRAQVGLNALIGKKLTDWALGELVRDGAIGASKAFAKGAFPAALGRLNRFLAAGSLAAKKLSVKLLGAILPISWVQNTWEYTQAVAEVSAWGVGAAYNVALHCVGKKVVLVPKNATRVAGEWQKYNLLVLNQAGKELGAAPPDSMRIGNGECVAGNPDWECFGKIAGPDPVVAEFGNLPPATGTLTVKPGPLHKLKLSPSVSETGINEDTPRFSAVGRDMFGNEVPITVGPLSKEAHLSIVPEGKCEITWCRAEDPGPHAITAQIGNISDVAEVKVQPNKIFLTPKSATIEAGQAQVYDAAETSWGGKLLRTSVPFGSGPDQAVLSIAPDGTCDQAAGTCTPAGAGRHTVTAKSATGFGEASLDVEEATEEIEWSGTLEIAGGFTLVGQDRYESHTEETDVTKVTLTEPSIQLPPVAAKGGFAHLVMLSGMFTSQGQGAWSNRESEGSSAICSASQSWDSAFSVESTLGEELHFPGLGVFSYPFFGILLYPDGRFLLTGNDLQGVPSSYTSHCHGTTENYEFYKSPMHACYNAVSDGPLPRSGANIVGEQTCHYTAPGVETSYVGEDTVTFDLVAKCSDSGRAPDQGWSCKS